MLSHVGENESLNAASEYRPLPVPALRVSPSPYIHKYIHHRFCEFNIKRASPVSPVNTVFFNLTFTRCAPGERLLLPDEPLATKLQAQAVNNLLTYHRTPCCSRFDTPPLTHHNPHHCAPLSSTFLSTALYPHPMFIGQIYLSSNYSTRDICPPQCRRAYKQRNRPDEPPARATVILRLTLYPQHMSGNLRFMIQCHI